MACVEIRLAMGSEAVLKRRSENVYRVGELWLMRQW